MIIKAIVIALLGSLVYFFVNKALFMGFHLHFFPHYPGKCSVVAGAGLGSEDLAVTSCGLAFATQGCDFHDQFKTFHKENGIKGGILMYDFKNPSRGAKHLKIKPSASLDLDNFHPHGISLLEDHANSRHLLYVVNHPYPDPDQVDKFRFDPETETLTHLKAFKSPLLRTANDLAVVEEDKFYISNFIYSNSKGMAFVEQLVPFAWCNLLFFDGQDFKEAFSDLVSPNGVTLSKDKKLVYVAMCLSKEVKVFSVQPDASLNEVQTADIHTIPDNLHLSMDGTALYVGAHPVVHQVIAYMEDPRRTAPSQVLKIPLNKDGRIQTEDVTELFYDDGRLVRASTVAAVWNGTLIIGSLQHTLVVCAAPLS